MCPTVSVMLLHCSNALLLTQTLVNFFSTVRPTRMSVWCTHLTHQIAHIPLFLYPFLNTTSKTRPFEYLRLTSLGVIGALVKVGCLVAMHYYVANFSRTAKRQQCRHSLPPFNRDHPSLLANYGDWFGVVENCCHLHSPENTFG